MESSLMADPDTKLTGNQIKCIRLLLSESQFVFAARIAVSQPSIHRLEKKGDEPLTGPDVMLIQQIAEGRGLEIPSPESAGARAQEIEAENDARLRVSETA